MERSGRMLERVNNAFFGVVQANTNPMLDKVQTAEAPKLAAHTDAIFLNPQLFARVKALYDRRAALKLDAEALQVLTLYYRQFVHAGANLFARGQDTAAARSTNRTPAWNRLSAKAGGCREGGSAGGRRQGATGRMSAAEIANAAQAAKTRKLTGKGGADKYVIPLQNTTQQPFADVAGGSRLARETVPTQLDTHREG